MEERMKKTLTLLLAGIVLAAAAGGPALAHDSRHGPHKRGHGIQRGKDIHGSWHRHHRHHVSVRHKSHGWHGRRAGRKGWRRAAWNHRYRRPVKIIYAYPGLRGPPARMVIVVKSPGGARYIYR